MQGHGSLKFTWRFIAAAIIYIAFALYLFGPLLHSFGRWHYLWPINVFIASIGCYILSRRWVAGFAGSCFAGAIYGFGPYMLGLAHFHPVTGALAAAVPWLFYPAAFGLKNRQKWLSVLFAAIPFFVIILFFQATTVIKLFPASTQAKLNMNELYSLFAPLVAAKHGTTLIGFYHIPLAALVMGSAMLIAARRYGIMVIIVSSIILVFCNPINSSFQISPVVWLSISIFCFSVIIGAGFQGLASTGFADRKWILANSIILGVFAIITLLLAAKYFQIFLSLGDGYARLFAETAKIYLLGAVVLAICFFMSCGKLQMHRIREIIISLAMALDIFISAVFIIHRVF
ncbi:MAG: hypothetical protein JW787_14960 [Sedimentisphaerales bacterium]|nr:hypothetical protein [Sedimentisphaerales bacterium]